MYADASSNIHAQKRPFKSRVPKMENCVDFFDFRVSYTALHDGQLYSGRGIKT